MSEDKSLIQVQDIFGIKEPLVKLIEVVERAGIALFKPWQIKREGNAWAESIKAISPVVRENIDLPIKYENGKITIDTTSSEDLESRAFIRLRNKEIKRQKNIESIVGESANILLLEDQVSDEKLNDDWISRFFNYAQDVSEAQMQKLWSQILSGEVKRPNTYSMRTLEVLKNLDKEVADDFVKISEYVFGGEYIPSVFPDDISENVFVDYSTILKLGEAGLIISSGAANIFESDQGFVYGNYFVEIKKDNESNITFLQFPLTKAGRELYTLITPIGAIDFLKSWASKLMKQNHKISYAKILSRTESGKIEKELPSQDI